MFLKNVELPLLTMSQFPIYRQSDTKNEFSDAVLLKMLSPPPGATIFNDPDLRNRFEVHVVSIS